MSVTSNLAAVLEWAPDGVTFFDPVSGQSKLGSTIQEAIGSYHGKVVVAVSRRVSFVRTVKLPDVARTDMSRILSLKLDSFLPIEQDEVAFDFLPLEHVDQDGREVLLVAMQTKTLRDLLAKLKQCNLIPTAIVPSSLSSIQLAASLSQASAAVVGKDATGYWIDIVNRGGLPASRSIAQDSILKDEVERTCLSAGLANVPIIVTGPISVNNATSFTGDPLQIMAAETPALRLELPEAKAAIAHKVVQRKKNLALLLWVAALGVGAVVFDIRTESASKVAAGQATWNKRLATFKTENTAAKARLTMLKKQEEVVSLAFEPKQPLGDVVTVLTTLAPAQLWLTGVSAERGKPLTLRGTALTSQAVTMYLESLSKQSRMRDVKLVFASNGLVEKTPVVNFAISAHVVGNLPLADDKGGKS